MHARSKRINSPPAGKHVNNLISLPMPAPATTLVDLFEDEESALLRFATGITGCRSAAEDIVQDAFLKLHELWAEVENPRAWIYRCTRNLALNRQRKEKRSSSLDQQPEHSDETPLPDEQLARLEANGMLRLIVSELEATDQQLLRLKYNDHKSYGEIAAATGLSISNVGYKLHHLLKSLAAKMKEAGIECPAG